MNQWTDQEMEGSTDGWKDGLLNTIQAQSACLIFVSQYNLGRPLLVKMQNNISQRLGRLLFSLLFVPQSEIFFGLFFFFMWL